VSVAGFNPTLVNFAIALWLIPGLISSLMFAGFEGEICRLSDRKEALLPLPQVEIDPLERSIIEN